MQSDIDRWNRKFRGRAVAERPTPDDWLIDNPWLPSEGSALDLASGSGQNAVYLAQQGLDVTAIDGSREGMALALALANNCGVALRTVVADLDTHVPDGQYDLVIVFHYLNRDLFPRLPGLLKPGGMLMVKTFNMDFLARKPGFNPDYVLQPGELSRLFAGLDVLADRESPASAPGKSLFAGRRRR